MSSSRRTIAIGAIAATGSGRVRVELAGRLRRGDHDRERNDFSRQFPQQFGHRRQWRKGRSGLVSAERAANAFGGAIYTNPGDGKRRLVVTTAPSR